MFVLLPPKIMASLYARPDSPPPRQPSPDILPVPLPCPRHTRRVASQPKIRIHSTPGLHARTKTLQSARSYDFLSPGPRPATADDDGRSSFRSERKRTRSIVASTLSVSSATSSPATSPATSARSTPDIAPHHRRTLSVAHSSSSQSPGPGAASHLAPPVPSMPYAYTGPKHIVCPKPVAPTSINLAELEAQQQQQSPSWTYTPAPFPLLPLPLPRSDEQQTKPAQLPPLERHKSMGMACLKFFRIRNPARQPQSRVAAM